LCGQSIRLLKEGLRIDDHAVAEHARLAFVHDARRQQVQHERPVSDLHGMAGIVAALVADDDVESLGEQIYDLALSFIAPLGADDSDNHLSEVRDQRSESKNNSDLKFQIPDSRFQNSKLQRGTVTNEVTRI
jgi:hypothetical protein